MDASVLASAPCRICVGAVGFLVLLVAERVAPLRRATQPKTQRVLVNLAVAACGGVLVAFLYGPIVGPAARFASERGFGLLNWIGRPSSVIDPESG